MKVKRNTWHYKFYRFISDGRPGRTTNLCAYFWKIVFGLSIATVLGAIALALIGLVGYAFYEFTAIAFTVLLGAVVGFGFIFLCTRLNNAYQDSQPGLVRLYLKAKKDKVCPLVEFEG